MRTFIITLAAVLALTACASIIKGTDQDVVINTPGAEGAQCELTSKRIGTVMVTTPATVNLKRSKHDIAVTCRKQCYQTTTGSMHSGVEGWTIGNILLGGVIGLGIDAWTGALNKYVTPSNIPMQKDPACEAAMAAPAVDPNMVMQQQAAPDAAAAIAPQAGTVTTTTEQTTVPMTTTAPAQTTNAPTTY
jgi:hypothetical protein